MTSLRDLPSPDTNPARPMTNSKMQEPDPKMETNTMTSRLILSLVCIFAISATAETPAPPKALMCTPGELIFSEDFDPETVSDRWFFKAEFALRDGALLRTAVDPTENKRVFLKNTIFVDE